MPDGHVIVVGGGPAGLVAARHLAEGGLTVDLFEASDDVGGRVRSRSHRGYTLDRGFQALQTGFPAVQRELDLDDLDLRRIDPGAVICRPGSRSTVADPFQDPGALLETLTNRELTTGDKLRLLRLRRELRARSWGSIFAGSDRSTLEALLDRGFSDGFVDAFARPFYGGITLDRSLETSSRVFEAVTKALLSGPSAVPADGMGAVTRQLARRAETAGATIHTGSSVETVSSDGERATAQVRGSEHAADAVVVATDARTARSLTGIESIPTRHHSCATQYYSLPEESAPDGRRIHLNATDEGPSHCLTLSNVVPEYADGDRALLSVTTLDDLEASDAKLDDRTRRALGSWYPERHFGDLELLATDRIEFGQFAQPPGSHDDLPDATAPRGPCYLAGEYTRWSSVAGAFDSGRTTAQRVLADH